MNVNMGLPLAVKMWKVLNISWTILHYSFVFGVIKIGLLKSVSLTRMSKFTIYDLLINHCCVSCFHTQFIFTLLGKEGYLTRNGSVQL